MKYLASFVRKDLFFDFCLPELISVCEMYNVPLKYDPEFSYDIKKDPLIHIDLPEENLIESAEKIVKRTVLTKNIIRIFSTGNTYEELLDNVDKELITKEMESSESFKFDVDARGKVMSLKEQVDTMELFDKYHFKGKVDLKNAQRTFVIIDNHSRGTKYFGKLIAGRSESIFYFYF